MKPLHLAAFDGRAAVAEQLLAAGANKEAKDRVRGHGECFGALVLYLHSHRLFLANYLEIDIH